MAQSCRDPARTKSLFYDNLSFFHLRAYGAVKCARLGGALTMSHCRASRRATRGVRARERRHALAQHAVRAHLDALAS